MSKIRHRKHTLTHTYRRTHTEIDSQTGEQSEFQINFTIIHALIISQNIMFSLCRNLELFSNYFLMSAKRRCCCCNPHPFPLSLSAPPPAGTCAAAAVALWKEISWQMAKSEIDFNDAPPTPTPSRQLPAVAAHRTWRTRAYIMFVNHKSLFRGGHSMCCQPRAVRRPHLPFPRHIKGSIAIERSLCTLRLIFS